MTQLQISQLLGGRYQIQYHLGGGGYGQTYLAVDRHLPTHPACIVKQLQPVARDPQNLQLASRLFNTEAEVLYKLGKHSQIPQLFAHFQQEGEFYLVQEYIEGTNLAIELARDKPWSEPEAIAFLQDILSALTFVHQQRVIHRDLKPSNLIRRHSDNRIVLLDFGAVKLMTTQLPMKGTQTVAVGTPGYMPIEQMNGNPSYSSDLYAVGMLAIQALTGLDPARNVLPRHPRSGEIDWHEYAPIEPELATVIDKLVCQNEKDRYACASDALKDLPVTQPQTEEIPIRPTGTTRVGMVALPKTRPLNRRKIYWGIFSLVAIASAGFFLSQQPSPSPAIPQAESSPRKASNPGNLRPNPASERDQQITQLLDRAREFADQGDYEKALEFSERALKLDNDNREAHRHRCLVLSPLKRYDYGSKACDRAVRLLPNDEKLWWNFGLALGESKRFEEALVAYDRALKIEPKFPEAAANQGLILHRLQRYSEAIQAYDRALAANANLPEIWNNRGASLIRLQRYDEALDSIDRALEIKSNYPQAWNNRGNALVYLQREAEALSAYEKAISLNPEYQSAITNRDLLQKKGNPE